MSTKPRPTTSSTRPARLVLLGGGHSHVEVLRRFGCRPEPSIALTVISRDRYSPYSGMLPGYVAGHYQDADFQIDLARLARYAGANFVHAEAIGLDREKKQLFCQSGQAVSYDTLSINIGSAPKQGPIQGAAEHATPVKPIDGFRQHWLKVLQRQAQSTQRTRIAVVGAGAAGVELILALHHRLSGPETRPGDFALFDAGTEVLRGYPGRAQRWCQQQLQKRGIALHLGQRVVRTDASGLETSDGIRHAADEVLLATPAEAPLWLASSGLAQDSEGFLQVNDMLQSLTDQDVFAAGDIASMVNHPRPKAGVIAVRQGPPLADNLRRHLRSEELRPFRPQKKWLSILATGDREAIACRGNLCVDGRWVWRWKNWIDRRFMARYRAD